MATTLYASSWTGSAESGKVTQRAYLTYTVTTNTATSYVVTVSSGIQQWNPTWTNIKTTCTLKDNDQTDYSSVSKTLSQSSGANHLHEFFTSKTFSYTKASSPQSKAITGTSKITGGVDSAHGSSTVLNKVSTVTYNFTVPTKMTFSGGSKTITFSTSAQNVGITAAQGGSGGFTYSKASGSFSVSGTNIVVPASTAPGTYTTTVTATDSSGVSISASYQINIQKATPTLSVTGATLTYSGSAQTLVSSASVTGGGTIYYGLGSSSTSAPGSWSTTKPTATNIGTYYIWAKADASTNYSAVAAVYKAAATIKAGTYTITLNANGGSGGTASVQITYGTTKGNYPSITRPTKTGYTFTGFYSATSGGTQWYDANGNSVRTFDLLANTTWYAQWSINSYTLTIDPNGGSWGGTTAVSTAPQNYNTTKSIAAPTRNGYVFVGWAETGAGRLSKINQADPAFDSSSGGVAIYNNSGGGTVTHTRQSSSAGAIYGSYEILINSSSGTTSPGNGGFYQPTTSAANQKYVHVFVAKIPAGYKYNKHVMLLEMDVLFNG